MKAIVFQIKFSPLQETWQDYSIAPKQFTKGFLLVQELWLDLQGRKSKKHTFSYDEYYTIWDIIKNGEDSIWHLYVLGIYR